jgi:hypothetical protein
VPNVIRFPPSISKSSISKSSISRSSISRSSISRPSEVPDTAAAKRSALDLFVSVALFSAAGLLVSLVLMLLGVSGAWY